MIALLAGLATSAAVLAPPVGAATAEADESTATFKTFDRPIPRYIDQKTCKVDLSRVPDFTLLDSKKMCGVTFEFSVTMEKRNPPANWPEWGTPPDVELANPNVLWTQGEKKLTITYVNGKDGTEGKKLVGLEAMPNAPGVHTIVADFADAAGNPLGSISRDVKGEAGAVLFAGRSVDGTETRTVTLSSDVDFAIAALRVTSSH